ncbi:MAG TPA: glycosyltransferase family 4 protein [Chloroflexota bacterium]|jgi:glycosyltransferase involved in cell wall biosynthesis|nr:glycosyltransferase family 4 protein [Chloroflexota bacterium]
MSAVKILAVHHGGGVGGAPVSLLKLLSRLDPTLFNPRAVFTEPGPILIYATDLGVPAQIEPTGGAFFYSAHARLEPRSLARFLRTFPATVKTARLTLRREKPDLLHLNTSVLLAWAAAARREHVPVIWMVREVLGPNPWLRRWHAAFITRHAHRVVTTSDVVRACFRSPGEANVERVYNAVDLTEFSPPSLAASAAARHDLGLSPDRQIVMAIGSVQRVKGHWLLLEALKHLPSVVDLVLVTGGVDASYANSARGRIKRALHLPLDNLDALLRDAAERGLSDRLYVTGFRRDVARALSAADVLAFPSLAAEGFGRPIIEAMALARPVVATDVGPSAELLGPDAGRLVPPDPRLLAAALSDLLNSPETRRRMGQAGRARVEACFSLDRQVDAMSAIYREAAAFG